MDVEVRRRVYFVNYNLIPNKKIYAVHKIYNFTLKTTLYIDLKRIKN